MKTNKMAEITLLAHRMEDKAQEMKPISLTVSTKLSDAVEAINTWREEYAAANKPTTENKADTSIKKQA